MKKRLVTFSVTREVNINEHATEEEVIADAHAQVQEEIDNGTFAFTNTVVNHAEEIGA